MRSSALNIIFFFVYVLVQVLILKNLVLFDVAFCFLYVAFILLLPVEMSPVALMFTAFGMGFLVDIFYSSMGLHAFALVITAYARNYWLGVITPQGGYDASVTPALAAYGAGWFLVYSIPLIFIHHATLFFLEAGGFDTTGFTIIKIFGSLLFTTLVVTLLQLMVPKRR
jgi:hypothetical protein